MLVLTRHVGEEIRIGHDIVIKFLALGPHQVRVGIAAPKHLTVHRQEIYEEIQAERAIDGAGEYRV